MIPRTASATSATWRSAGTTTRALGGGGAGRRGLRLAACGNGDFGRLGLGAAGGDGDAGGTGHGHSHGADADAAPGGGGGGTASAVAMRLCARAGPWRQAAAGGAHSAAVSPAGEVFVCGLNDRGQLGLGQAAVGGSVAAPTRVAFDSVTDGCDGGLGGPVAAVACGHFHTLAVTRDGAVYAWGANDRGQLGLGREAGALVPAPTLVAALAGHAIVGVSAGAEHSLAVSATGEVFSWGAAANGRLGHGEGAGGWFWGPKDEGLPRLVRPLAGERVAAVAAGHLHSGCVEASGRVFTWGAGRFSQLGLGRAFLGDLGEPTEVPGLRAKKLALGGLHSLALSRGGDVFAWGSNQHGCLGLGGREAQSMTPVKVEGLSDVADVAAGWKHSAAVRASDGALLAWGWGGAPGAAMDDATTGGGQLGRGDNFDYWTPARARPPAADLRAVAVSAGFNHTVALWEEAGAAEP